MLVINWKKHYDVPTLFYTDTAFRSVRKGKFFFLSDLIFNLIHKFCFKYILYKYIEFFFYRRLKQSCLNVSKTIYRPIILLNRSSFHATSLSFFRNLNIFKVSFERRYNNFSFLNHFTNFISFFTLLKKKLLKIKSTFFFVLYFLLKKYKINFSSYLISYLTNYLFFFLMMIEQNFFSYNNNNILFIFYQIKVLKEIINKKFFYFINKIKLVSIFIKYLKSTLNINSIVRMNKNFENKYSYFLYKCKLKNINSNFNNIYSFYTYLNIFLNTFHNTLYYYFFINKIIHLKYDNKFNSLNFNSLKFKKELLNTFKNQFFLFKDKIYRVRFRYRKVFNRFMKSILIKNQWLVGRVHKFKIFRYFMSTYIKIKKFFESLHLKLVGSRNKEKSISFFYNPVKIRENLFYFLGKKRYKEEFILLKNKKWYLKYYLKQFYNLNFRTFVSFYKELRNKFKVILIKDLFSFLENKVSVFMKKHVFYAFSSINNITLNMNNISASSSTLVFIGNVIGIKSTFYYFYERFMIFFNFLYFIDPILLNKKFILLSLLYKRLYNNFYNSNSLFFQLNPSYNKPFELNLFYSLKENSFISSFIQKVKYFSYNIYIKSMFFFICKYKLLSIKKSEIYKNKKTFSYNYKKLLYFFSFNKYLYKYNLINFKRSFLLKLNRKRKKIRFRGRGRRYRLFLNVFNWLKYKKRTSIIYKNSSLSSSLNQNVYRSFFSKKAFFLKKKALLNKLIYFSNY